jgi:putative transcriptional regulator|tara:strand:- start:37 stop:462 length:426 start_codon:yes stop_codon:yes gene_type:complete
MSKRHLFAELTTSLSEVKEHSEGKLTLKTHKLAIADELVISPNEILSIREKFNMSRGVFANYLHTSVRTLDNWEQGRSAPNGQAVTLLKLVQSYPETLSHIAYRSVVITNLSAKQPLSFLCALCPFVVISFSLLLYLASIH